MKAVRAVRGMEDILPEYSRVWQWLESLLYREASSYGYDEVRFPVVEKSVLFRKSLGEVSDVVTKEMYSFEDRNGESLTLRPEGTASCVRLGLEHGLLHNQKQRFFYYGPMFRRERPQKGRYRQFYQFGLEAFGFSGVEIEVEQLLLLWHIWKLLDLEKTVRLEINTIGELEERHLYRESLVEYFSKYQDILDEDNQRRLLVNPLRILDSKSVVIQDLLKDLPSIFTYLTERTKQRFHNLCDLLTKLSLPFVVNAQLVRGLDYYNQTVFEWKLDQGGQQNTICAGGRYDHLVTATGGKATNCFGFAMGVERVLALVEKTFTPLEKKLVYLAVLKLDCNLVALQLGERLREAGWSVALGLEGELGSHFKQAERNQARVIIILEEKQNCCIKWGNQSNKVTVALDKVVEFLTTVR